jgi:asparagine synthase (glutamine-hydrolysing)
MCGICGKLWFDKGKEIHEDLIASMLEVLRHRGPDDQGFYVNGCVGLGHRRLSVIDIRGGRQPMANEDMSIWVICNGEIYNFKELRDLLRCRGHVFRTNSDSEVILHAYEEWKEDFLSRLKGMFAFALWDNRQKRLLLARDRFGEKPLYYRLTPEGIAFASELKALTKDRSFTGEIDETSIDEYLTYQFVPGPTTIFREIKRLPPAHFLTVQEGRVAIEPYWHLTFARTNYQEEKYHVKRLTESLRRAVISMLVSDVPLGAFLSGGLDSSLIVALMKGTGREPIKTFSIGFEEKGYDELSYARMVSKCFNTDHHEYELGYDIRDLLPKIVWHLDEPFADASVVPAYYLCEIARKSVTVALSGDGCDELFAGYRRYLAKKLGCLYQRIPPKLRESLIPWLVERIPQRRGYYGRSLAKKIAMFVDHTKDSNFHRLSWTPVFSEREKRQLYTEGFLDLVRENDSPEIVEKLMAEWDGEDKLSKYLFVDQMLYLSGDILTKVDRMSMAHSLETRIPFLDHELVEYVSTIPMKLKLKGFQSKYILKKVASAMLPKVIIHRRKQGFMVPISEWFREDLHGMIRDILLSRKAIQRGYFRPTFLSDLVEQHQKGYRDHSHKLWALLMFELWNRVFLD